MPPQDPASQTASEATVRAFQAIPDERKRDALGKMSNVAKQALLAGIKTYGTKTPSETPGASKITGISAPSTQHTINVGGVPFTGQESGLDRWLRDVKSDVQTGGTRTLPGRVLHRMGAPGTESGEPKGLPGNVAKMAGTLLPVGAAPEMASSMVPSAARASAQFEDVAGFIGKHTVPMSEELLAATKRAAQLANSGLQAPQVLSDWAARLNRLREQPLTWEEARDFYSSATGRLSPDELRNLNPRMKAQLARFAKALGAQISKVAERGGFREEYEDAMREWRAVKRIGSVGRFVTKKALPTAGVLGAGYEIYKRATGATSK